MEEKSRKFGRFNIVDIIILAIVMAIVVGVFVLWLKVRFPEGILFEMLL